MNMRTYTYTHSPYTGLMYTYGGRGLFYIYLGLLTLALRTAYYSHTTYNNYPYGRTSYYNFFNRTYMLSICILCWVAAALRCVCTCACVC